MVPTFIKLNMVSDSIVEKFKRVDWLGNAIFISATTSFLIPLTWGGVQYPWGSWHTLVPLLIGVAGLVSFSVYEIYIAVEFTIRLGLVKSYNMAYSFDIVRRSLFLPLYFVAVRGYNPILSGVPFFPATFAVTPVSIISGIIINKTSDFCGVTWLGWLATTIGCGVMISLDVETTILQWVFLCMCIVIGLGFLYKSLMLVNQTASDDSNVTFAISLFIFFRAIGQCIGVAICGVVFQNQMETRLLAIPSLANQAGEYSKDASSTVLTITSLPNSDSKKITEDCLGSNVCAQWSSDVGELLHPQG